mgnify:CR=1 FL=1
MSIREYLEAEEFSELVKYRSEPSADAIAFVGTLRKHPYDEEKCLLIADSSSREPSVYEFRVADVVAVDELPSPVDEAGHSRPLAKLWLRRGSFGIRYVPFEVDEPLKGPGESRKLRDSLMNSGRAWS